MLLHFTGPVQSGGTQEIRQGAAYTFGELNGLLKEGGLNCAGGLLMWDRPTVQMQDRPV